MIERSREIDTEQLYERLHTVCERLSLGDSDHVSLLLLFAGYKRANELHIVLDKFDEDDNPSATEIQKSARISFSKTELESLGLFVKIGAREVGNIPPPAKGMPAGMYETVLMTMSLDEKNAERLCELFSMNVADPNVDNKEIGILLGYPETAADAYQQSHEKENLKPEDDPRILTKDLPKEILSQDFMAFVTFRLSKEHWKDELEVVKRWAEAVKKYDPALYERWVERYHRERQHSENGQP